jgi:predicted metalloendopeptidase
VDADAKNSNKIALYLSPSGLGLPERDYYMKSDSSSLKIQKAYKQFMTDMLTEFGEKANAASIAEDIYNLEKKMATAMLTKEQRRNPVLQYNPMTAANAGSLLSALSLKNYTTALNINPDTIVVTEPNYIKAVNQLVNDKNLNSLKWLMKWSTMRGAASFLNDKLENLKFSFYGKTLRGTPALKPRKERALDMVNSMVGEALGKLYVEKFFPADAKTKAKELVDDLIAAYRVRINNLEWMSAATKAKAQKKLDKLTIKIGYPDKWRDYSKLEIKGYAEGGSYMQNVYNAGRFEVLRNAAKYGKPVDKSEWYMSPQTVNAYYNPAFNEIVFPASILQAPFFDFRNDAAVNFGGIGAVIGHEISHGFDDQGAQYDENGNLTNWWTEDDLKKFKTLGQKLIEQFNGYEALPGQFVNGEFTLGENIGDLGGVASAYDGLQIYLKRNPKENVKVQGMSPEQRFFFSWATVWRNKIRDEELAMRLKTDPHSPGYFRAIGPLQNHEGFYKAFDVKSGDKMHRADSIRVKIW